VQGACVLSINEPAVTIKNIENAIIDYAWQHGLVTADLPQDYTGKQIAVVGSGPAGLACAAQLNKVATAASLCLCISARYLYVFICLSTSYQQLRLCVSQQGIYSCICVSVWRLCRHYLALSGLPVLVGCREEHLT